jgi:uncharacterized FAD-dependent dehydrogenase
MPQSFQITIPAEFQGDLNAIQRALAKSEKIDPKRINHIEIRKKSIDARGKQIKCVLSLQVWVDEAYQPENPFQPDFKQVKNEEEIYIIGAGPAGYFAALHLLELGKKPIVIERGKNVRDRRRDLAALTKNHLVHTESNYCFGEGGAGTYSDGKLYTRSDKRGDIKKILDLFIYFGAPPEIGIDAKPHIGTNKLPQIIQNMRECICSFGGEVHFETRMDDFEVQFNRIHSITFNGTQKVQTSKMILATGHSSRMIFEMLHKKNILLEAKPFALGVRAEHPQQLIDEAQYHCKTRPGYLPAAYYSFVSQELERGVYSFCMCPGGIIAPCSTSPGEIVTNGWSPSKRNSPYANSGIVTEIRLEDMIQAGMKESPLMAMEFQQSIEQLACQLAGNNQTAPAQRLTDFVTGKTSTSLPKCSYTPGVASVNLQQVLPDFVTKRLQSGFKNFAKKMPAYYSQEAILVAPESRTSSPIKIPRNTKSLQHPEVAGLLPCAEGAGYAGGIVSAAIDGIKCAACSIF